MWEAPYYYSIVVYIAKYKGVEVNSSFALSLSVSTPRSEFCEPGATWVSSMGSKFRSCGRYDADKELFVKKQKPLSSSEDSQTRRWLLWNINCQLNWIASLIFQCASHLDDGFVCLIIGLQHAPMNFDFSKTSSIWRVCNNVNIVSFV